MASAAAPVARICLADLPEGEQELLTQFLCAEKVQFAKQADGSYLARVRLTDGDLGDDMLDGSDDYEDEHLIQKERQDAAEAAQRRRAGAGGSSPAGVSPSRSSATGIMDAADLTRALSSRGVYLDARPFRDFIAALKLRSVPRLKHREQPWCMRIIEEIYDERYKREHELLAEEDAAGGGVTGRAPIPFHESVVKYISKRYGLPSIVEQNCLDLLYNVVRARSESPDCDIFARLLEGYYDSDELLFLLYVRSVAQKVLGNVSFRAMWSEMGPGSGRGGGSARPRLDERQCSHVARIVYGSEASDHYLGFMAVVGEHLRSTGEDTVEVGAFLLMAVEEYHATTSAERAEDAEDMGAARDEADTDRLVSQAERAYDGRQRGGRDAAAASAVSSSSAGPSPTGTGAGSHADSAKHAILERLADELQRGNEDYVEQLVEGMGGMEDDARDQVRAELMTALSTEVDRLLMQAIQDTDRGRTPVDEAINPIGARFYAVLSSAGSVPDDEVADRIDNLCSCITESPEVQKCMEPVVTLMFRVAGGNDAEDDDEDEDDEGDDDAGDEDDEGGELAASG